MGGITLGEELPSAVRRKRTESKTRCGEPEIIGLVHPLTGQGQKSRVQVSSGEQEKGMRAAGKDARKGSTSWGNESSSDNQSKERRTTTIQAEKVRKEERSKGTRKRNHSSQTSNLRQR